MEACQPILTTRQKNDRRLGPCSRFITVSPDSSYEWHVMGPQEPIVPVPILKSQVKLGVKVQSGFTYNPDIADKKIIIVRAFFYF
jgi:hypothetical protein